MGSSFFVCLAEMVTWGKGNTVCGSSARNAFENKGGQKKPPRQPRIISIPSLQEMSSLDISSAFDLSYTSCPHFIECVCCI